MIRSVFRYPGGKAKNSIRKKILSKMPYDISEYREPFVGGGGIFFAITSKDCHKRWINDVNDGLISVYLALRDRPSEFIDLCRNIEPLKDGEPESSPRQKNRGGKKYNARLMGVFDSLKYNEDCDQALRYFFINRTVWGGRVNYHPEMESRMYFSNPEGWNIVSGDSLQKAANHVAGSKISNTDYSVLLNEPGDNVVIYCDPPYIVDTDLSRMSKLYEKGFTKDDHVALAKTAKKCKHNLCISYDDKPLVRELYTEKDGFFVYEEEWSYCGTSSKEKEIGKELIITNYEVDNKKNFYTRVMRNQSVLEDIYD